MKNTVVFDLDGTLTDSAMGIFNAIKYLIEKENLTDLTSSQLRSCIGPPLNESFMRLWNVDFETAERFVSVYREYYVPTGVLENEVYPGIKDLLSSLKRKGYVIRICSTKPTVLIEKVLNHFDLMQYFEDFSGVELKGKLPDKAVRLRAMLKDKNAVMIGDRRDDMFGAKGAGITGIGVLWGYGSKEELLKSGADMLAENTVQLEEMIDSVFN